MASEDFLRRRLERERKARKEAERLLEERSRELYYINQALEHSRDDTIRAKVYLDNIIASMNDALFVLTEEGTIKSVNRSATQLTGFGVGTLEGTRMGHLLYRSEGGEINVQDMESLDVDIETRHGNVPVLVSTAPFYPGSGEEGGYVCVVKDMRERVAAKRLETERDVAKSENQAKSVFLANMSHEIRTPLNAIIGFSQLLQASPLSDQEREYVDTISQSGEALLTLINDILEMSKIEAGRLELSLSVVDLRGMLDKLCRSFEPQTQRKNLQLHLQYDSPSVPCVQTDEGKLRQVFANLINNAVKFTERGEVVVSARIEQGARGRATLHGEVRDTGSGIGEHELSTLFEPFVQTESGRESQRGTGLGLAISRNIVQLMGGDIAVSSTIGKGTSFYFHLNVEIAAESGVERNCRSDSTVVDTSEYNGVRILIVDDNGANRLLLWDLLEPLGFQLHEVANGEDAVLVCDSWHPHIILMDMAMPVMDGYEATRRIKSKPDSRDTVVIAVTASAFQEDYQQILESGVDDFLAKPFTREQLFETLRGHLDETTHAARGKRSVEPLDAPALTSLDEVPDRLLDEMRDAVKGGHIERLTSLVDSIRGAAPAFASTLDQLAKEFDYAKMLAILGDPDE